MKEGQGSVPNYHGLSKELGARRRALEEAHEILPESSVLELKKEIDDLKKVGKTFADLKLNPSETKEFMLKQREEAKYGIDEDSIREEIGPGYEILKKIHEKYKNLSDFEISQLRKSASDPHEKRANISLLSQIKKEKTSVKNEIQKIEEDNPVTSRAFEIVSFRNGLLEEGHIAHTPSVDKYLMEIGRRMIDGKPMFLHGPTGTGKTSLARYAAKHFTGKNAEMVYCTPQTRDSHIWGKTGI